jgi:hypothetical protein
MDDERLHARPFVAEYLTLGDVTPLALNLRDEVMSTISSLRRAHLRSEFPTVSRCYQGHAGIRRLTSLGRQQSFREGYWPEFTGVRSVLRPP